jgi:hypothetical protein
MNNRVSQGGMCPLTSTKERQIIRLILVMTKINLLILLGLQTENSSKCPVGLTLQSKLIQII